VCLSVKAEAVTHWIDVIIHKKCFMQRNNENTFITHMENTGKHQNETLTLDNDQTRTEGLIT